MPAGALGRRRMGRPDPAPEGLMMVKAMTLRQMTAFAEDADAFSADVRWS